MTPTANLTILAMRLYARMLVCPCDFTLNCVQCRLDLKAIRAVGEYDNLASIDSQFSRDMDKILSISNGE